jgi:hypothetical protein
MLVVGICDSPPIEMHDGWGSRKEVVVEGKGGPARQMGTGHWSRKIYRHTWSQPFRYNRDVFVYDTPIIHSSGGQRHISLDDRDSE